MVNMPIYETGPRPCQLFSSRARLRFMHNAYRDRPILETRVDQILGIAGQIFRQCYVKPTRYS